MLASSLYCAAGDLTSKEAFIREEYKRGIAAFETKIAAHPADAGLLVGLGQLHYRFNKYTEAKSTLERALAIEPNHAVAHNYLGMMLSQEGRMKEALKHFDLAIKSNPNYADAHFNRAVALATSTPPDKAAARESYKRAVGLGSESDSPLEQVIK